MRLLVLTQYFWPENFRVNDLTAELARRGHDVTVLTGRPNYPGGTVFPDYAADPAAFSCYHGCRVVRVPLVPRGRSKLRLALNYLSFVLAGSLLGPFKLGPSRRCFDAIFVFAPSPITAAMPALVLKRLYGIPVALWTLDLWPQSLEAMDAVRSRMLLKAVTRLVHAIYRRCDLILVQSRGFVQQLARDGVSARVAYFPSWSEDLPPPETVDPAPEVALRSDTFDIVFAGNIGVAQDFPAILAAAEILRHEPVRWLIVGDGKKLDWLRQEVARRHLQNIELLGPHPLHRMPSFFRHADALLVALRNKPAFSVTIPSKLQTYLAAGRPILAMLDGDGQELVRHAQAGLAVAAGDAAGLAAAVRDLRAPSAQERSEMGRHGRRYHSRHFDRASLITHLEDWLGELASRRNPQQS